MIRILKNYTESIKTISTRQILPDITAGLVTGMMSVFTSISLAAMVFSGGLNRYLAIGIGISLFSNIIIRTIVTLFSSFPGIISNPQPEQMTILALIAAAICHKMTHAAPEELFATVAVAIASSSILTGFFLLLLGPLKISEIVRYIPYPIVGGFLAGIGWLMIQGAMTFMVGQPFSLNSIYSLLQSTTVIQWLPGFLFAVLLLLVSRKYSHYLVISSLILSAIAIFYGILIFDNISISEASSRGWLLGPFPEGGLWKPLTLTRLSQANWAAVFSQSSSILTIMILSALSLILNVIGLEVITGHEINLKRELFITGIANLFSGFAGGMVGSHSLKSSILAYRMSGRSRLVGLVAAAIFVIVLIFGSSFLVYFPKSIMGGLLIYLGLSLLVDWGYDASFKLPKVEYLTVLSILAVISTAGFLAGIGFGLVVATFLFVFKYSQIDATRRILSGSTHQSNVQRSPQQQTILSKKGDQIYILELQGFIFFGTANNLLKRLRERVEKPNNPTLQYLILDFRLVSGLDSSAVLSFVKIQKFAFQHQIMSIFTTVSQDIYKQLERGGCFDAETLGQRFIDLDRGIEWCENTILATSEEYRYRSQPILLQLEALFGCKEQAEDFFHYLEQVEIAQGDFVFHQGDFSDGIYFVSSGQVSVLQKRQDSQTKRLRAFRAGAIVGEMGAYEKKCRSASVVADQASCLYRLSNEALERVGIESPELAIALYKFTISSLSERLSYIKQESQIINPRTSFQIDNSNLVESDSVEQSFESFESFEHEPRDDKLIVHPNTARPQYSINPLYSLEVEHCRKELLNCIGPLADLLVKDAIAKNPLISPLKLIEVLAEQIPDEQLKLEFQQRAIRHSEL